MCLTVVGAPNEASRSFTFALPKKGRISDPRSYQHGAAIFGLHKSEGWELSKMTHWVGLDRHAKLYNVGPAAPVLSSIFAGLLRGRSIICCTEGIQQASVALKLASGLLTAKSKLTYQMQSRARQFAVSEGYLLRNLDRANEEAMPD
ncbi:hypothetical protein TWF718_004693 [Orbilia javanica]|uniref:Uncharacterized protein n=1 Tax=Orbilia javanica TaxID=47235 RepID=A0AAN8RF74_9PEZI